VILDFIVSAPSPCRAVWKGRSSKAGAPEPAPKAVWTA